MSQSPNEQRPRMTLDIYDENDWLGTLRVGCYEDADRSFWWWGLSNDKTQALDGGEQLEMAGPQTQREAMRVLLLFLLVTADSPMTDFTEATSEWVRKHREALEKALEGL